MPCFSPPVPPTPGPFDGDFSPFVPETLNQGRMCKSPAKEHHAKLLYTRKLSGEIREEKGSEQKWVSQGSLPPPLVEPRTLSCFLSILETALRGMGGVRYICSDTVVSAKIVFAFIILVPMSFCNTIIPQAPSGMHAL